MDLSLLPWRRRLCGLMVAGRMGHHEKFESPPGGDYSKMFPRRMCTTNHSSPKIGPGDLRSQVSAAEIRDFFDPHPLLCMALLTFCRAEDLWLCLLGSWWKDSPAPNCCVTPASFRQRRCNMKATSLKPNGDFSGHIFKTRHESG